MLGAYFSPLAPAAVLLLSAFILPAIGPRLPVERGIRRFSAPALVLVAFLSLLGTRLTIGPDASGQGLELLSGWNFSIAESAAALVVRVDTLGLPFLIVIMLVLLAVTLLRSTTSAVEPDEEHWIHISGWLLMGAAACLLFVSANGLTLVYAVLAFDGLTGLYWLGRGHWNVGVARLFLGILTAAGLILATLALTISSTLGIVGVVLWLRLGLYPFMEATLHSYWRSDERLIYISFSLSVGFYLTIRGVSEPLPPAVQWLIIITMLLSGLLTWLTAPAIGTKSFSEHPQGQRASLLVWAMVTEALLLLLVSPLATGPAIAFAVGMILSLAALWITPALGWPRFRERAWSWPYLPAVTATATVIGLPLSLGWLARLTIYHSLFFSSTMAIGLVILAEGLALSGLTRYWLMLGHGEEPGGWRSAIGIVVMVPFLVPGLGLILLAAIANIDLSTPTVDLSIGLLTGLLLVVIFAICLGCFRQQILTRLQIPVESVIKISRLIWLYGWFEARLNQIGKVVLWIRVTLEGQHYLGWAIFSALIAALIILLN